jgi:hypothetical protein
MAPDHFENKYLTAMNIILTASFNMRSLSSGRNGLTEIVTLPSGEMARPYRMEGANENDFYAWFWIGEGLGRRSKEGFNAAPLLARGPSGGRPCLSIGKEEDHRFSSGGGREA